MIIKDKKYEISNPKFLDFWKHQKTCVRKTITEIVNGLGSVLGRIVIPTGGGKTWIQAAILEWQIKHNSQAKVHVVLAPRIVLANQLINEHRDYLGYDKHRVIAFHSGLHEPENEKITWKEQNTTNVSVLKEHIDVANKAGVDLVVYSTYHSAERLSGLIFDTLIADESQYCVAENFGENVKKITARVRLFFTATEKFTASKNGRGLNNEQLYGKRLFTIKARTLIQQKLIVPPRLHIMNGKAINSEKSLLDIVIQLAKAQHTLTLKDLTFSKQLFAMKGTDDVKTINQHMNRLNRHFPNHTIFTITSKQGARMNGVQIKREEFLEKLKTCVNALIFHYDILSEGIDVDGITGVHLLRNLGLAKLLQTIGRAIRLYKPDPSLKKQAWISVPVINGDEDDKERVKKIITDLRLGGHKIDKEDIFEFPGKNHEQDDENITDAFGKEKTNSSSMFVSDILHEIENDDFLMQVQSANTIKNKIDILFEEVHETQI